ncbi:carbon storage regulator CsrA [Campylobacter canadensis]|uniref:Translational regulator CsrA n=1 Tax=Campylobacter canadensis TaxID=449520 RepID=A0ABS7WTG7_9BACT|nr:carbon storage regulator CsrA [Campylobacter canadensis]MBZ7987592.1 carbon storage regulator CsrA [Campylobacter canadensis]MBZ7994973.1 carbon storage regulator CsrA [Campylobacter canadensis]MBZ7996877.1 carbon storage regulator CsrA [Campylobacter canadensis]MBZ7998762.1 carbon storage regulator CsrA [Campylobacter canadensis]MBZ8000356.1 carbon storage regulator CsrA [Campylobacter canadensis]
MLIISRKIDSSLIIDGGIEIKILDIKGDNVKLGINAPKQTLVLREELINCVRDENIHANNDADLSSLKDILKNYKK